MGNKIPTKIFLTFSLDLFGLNLSKLDLKNYDKQEMCRSPSLSLVDSPERKERALNGGSMVPAPNYRHTSYLSLVL